ncbi:leucine-rich repeat domain-containing protein [Blastopirellula marina]|uniref:DUF1570 domain-containing protein n=1 Tax=Blastopirellula marina TaxID=124 RepID=A0A2S8F5B7_9BACT|nr:hypothetical protein [Blastopirellula marina]PQO27124.1 hypothetical protein C5Y98_28150 [Blastopirellula marina]PTL41271.1 hypothetical protein C5Y97_28165 [Blastopirellula marina]
MLFFTTAILLVSAATMDTAAPSRSEIDQRYQAELAQLAAKCDEVGLPAQAKITREWIVRPHGEENLFFLVPESDPFEPTADAPPLVQFWYKKFRALRDAQADALFQHAQQLLATQAGPASYRTLHEVLRENPDHADARRILGYNNVNGTWRRPGVTTRAKQPRFAHPKFGWPMKSFWQIDTPHFQIMTNESEAAGLELGKRLEIVYSAWEQMFFSFWSNERQLASYFDGGTPSPVRKKFDVVLFKTRGEYVNYLEKSQPRIGITLGIYQFDEEMVFLFHDDSDQAHATWHHEVTHQLFQEYRVASKDVGVNYNAWAIEAVAMYLESLRIHDGYMTLGGIDATRLQFARNRFSMGDFYIKLDELVAMGRSELQKSQDIGAIYSEAAGLAHFFLDGDGGKFREPFIQYLVDIYQRNDREHSLAMRLGQKSLSPLDQQYASYLAISSEQILALPEGSPTTDLALGKCPGIDDRALARIGTFAQLTWLDLTFTSITSEGVGQLKGCQALRDLSVASTHIDDAALATIGKLNALEELDLSGTAISDQGLVQLKSLAKLKVLRMAVTQISDAGLLQLSKLKNLEMIDARQTRITPAGVERLKQSLPQVVVHL